MLTLLIAVQQAVERTQLGIATSLNQFTRSIGGAFGVAIMGAVLTAGLATQLHNVALSGTTSLTVDQAAVFASNPNALDRPRGKSEFAAGTLVISAGCDGGGHSPGILGSGLHILFGVDRDVLFTARPARHAVGDPPDRRECRREDDHGRTDDDQCPEPTWSRKGDS